MPPARAVVGGGALGARVTRHRSLVRIFDVVPGDRHRRTSASASDEGGRLCTSPLRIRRRVGTGSSIFAMPRTCRSIRTGADPVGLAVHRSTCAIAPRARRSGNRRRSVYRSLIPGAPRPSAARPAAAADDRRDLERGGDPRSADRHQSDDRRRDRTRDLDVGGRSGSTSVTVSVTLDGFTVTGTAQVVG